MPSVRTLLATDDEDRIVFWNQGAVTLFGRPSEDVVGRYCYDIVKGRDLLGNHYCYRDCPIVANRRVGEPANGSDTYASSGLMIWLYEVGRRNHARSEVVGATC